MTEVSSKAAYLNDKDVYIGRYKYVIKIAEEVKDEDDDKTYIGLINLYKRTITLRSDLPDDLMFDVLMHEIVHGILYNMGFACVDNIDVEIVATLPTAITDVLVANPWLSDFYISLLDTYKPSYYVADGRGF